jgi:DNA-binding Xre family transcriptional regulator
MFNYEPLWETMREKNITQYQLIKDYDISNGTLDNLRKNNSITIYTLEKLCLILDCQPNDIIKIEK